MGRVGLSLGIPNFGGWCGGDWQALCVVATAADQAGIERIVVNDHVVMGPHTENYVWGRFPTAPDGPWLEPLTVLTMFAGVTSTIRLATGVIIAPLRPAVVLAKTVATLDLLSGGRVDLGVGTGWQREEYDAGGLPFDGRGRLLDHTIGACRELWSSMPASYSSTTISFTDTYCSPQPTQPRLPVWFSGPLHAANLRRIADLGDGWIPIMGSTVDDIRDGAERLSSIGRSIEVQASLPVIRRDDGGVDMDATVAAVPSYADAGATNIYLNIAALAPNPADAVNVIPLLANAFSAVTS